MTARIDREKLHVALEGLDEDIVMDMLAEALDLLPPAKLAAVVGRHLDLARLRPDASGARAMRAVLADVQEFDVASRRGRYYETFRVNSRNYMEKSAGTREFIAEYNRLCRRCVASAASADPALAVEAFGILFNLLYDIDEEKGDIIFFADEAGSWQVGVDWAAAFPAWFACLARTAAPDEYARLVVHNVDAFEDYARDKHFATARLLGTPEQQAALDAYLATATGHQR
jgi:hypothetical protein